MKEAQRGKMRKKKRGWGRKTWEERETEKNRRRKKRGTERKRVE